MNKYEFFRKVRKEDSLENNIMNTYRDCEFEISEILVDHSKWHYDDKTCIENIRKTLNKLDLKVNRLFEDNE